MILAVLAIGIILVIMIPIGQMITGLRHGQEW